MSVSYKKIICASPEFSSLKSNPLLIPAPIELMILSICTKGRTEAKPELKKCRVCPGESISRIIRLTSTAGFECRITWSLRQPVPWMSVLWIGNTKEQEEEKVCWSCSRGFISVCQALIPDPLRSTNRWSEQAASSSQVREKPPPVAVTDPTRVFKRAASEQIVFTGRWTMKVATWIKAVGGHFCICRCTQSINAHLPSTL